MSVGKASIGEMIKPPASRPSVTLKKMSTAEGKRNNICISRGPQKAHDLIRALRTLKVKLSPGGLPLSPP